MKNTLATSAVEQH